MERLARGSAPRGLRYVVTTYPVTLLTLGILAVVAWLTGTNAVRLPRPVLDAVGFPEPGPAMGQAYRIVTSAWVTNGPRFLPGALIMVALSLGAAERRTGSLVTLATFWGIHAATLLGMYLGIQVLEALAPQLGMGALLGTPDVGPSAGYMGCLGLALRWGEGPWWRVLSAGVVFWLLADVAGLVSMGPGLRAENSADVAHLLAFSMGWLVGSTMLARRQRVLAALSDG